MVTWGLGRGRRQGRERRRRRRSEGGWGVQREAASGWLECWTLASVLEEAGVSAAVAEGGIHQCVWRS